MTVGVGRCPLLAGVLTGVLVLVPAGCTSPVDASPGSEPYILVLGTAQDGGLPQIGCEAACCTRARADPDRRRLVTSLLLVDPASGQRWLFDASPDLPEQVERAADHPAGHRAGRVADGGRPPLFDGVFLTHGHMGHYGGLMQLGREAYGVTGQVVYGSESMSDYLASNGPWSLMVENGRLDLRVVTPDEPVTLAADLSVTPILVPHRHEFTDTLAFRIDGPNASLLYLPDIDKWDRWDRSLAAVLRDVDAALIDGTFHADGEISGRSMADIPHPFMLETMWALESLPASERRKVIFTHLNHTNPAADPDSEAAVGLREYGLAVASDGLILRL